MKPSVANLFSIKKVNARARWRNVSMLKFKAHKKFFLHYALQLRKILEAININGTFSCHFLRLTINTFCSSSRISLKMFKFIQNLVPKEENRVIIKKAFKECKKNVLNSFIAFLVGKKK